MAKVNKKDERTNNDIQDTTKKAKDQATRTTLKTEGGVKVSC